MNKKVKIKKSKEDVVFDIVNISILSIVLIVVLFPLIYVLSASLSDPMLVLRGEIWLLPKNINFGAYKKVFMNENIMTGYINTIMYTAVGTIVNVVLTIAAAYPLSRKSFYGRNLIMIMFTITMFFQGGIIPLFLVVRNLDLINSFWVMILPKAILMWNLIIMRTYFQNSIPEELIEAAAIDGCSSTRALFKVVLPLSKPIIAVIALFYGVRHWNAFFDALIFLTDQDKYPLQLVLREILIQTQLQDMMSSGLDSIAEQQLYAESIKYAVIIVASVPALIVYPFIQKYFVKGVMVGAIKG